MMIDEILMSQITLLLNRAGLSPVIKTISHCMGGNNRTYKVITRDGCFAVKQYFRQAEDTRNRLISEFSFLSYAKKVAPHFVPTPYIYDADHAIALYEFIEGQMIQPDDIHETDIAQAIQFFCALNDTASRNHANDLALAAEACFTLEAHLNLINLRLHALQNMNPLNKEDELAQKIVNKLYSFWTNMTNETKLSVGQEYGLTSILQTNQRCISPSDFGFHNALKMSDGSIRFIDFEYAGWDDPAKMVGDFFSQLAVPVPKKYFDSFTHQVMQPFACPDELIKRAKCLRVIYQIKWCCIILNIFLPNHLERRRFANPKLNIVDLKRTQLTKAASLLQLLEQQYGLY